MKLKEKRTKRNLGSLFLLFYSNIHVADFIFSISFYLFGSIYCDYVGIPIDLMRLLWGLLAILFLLVAMEFLNLLFSSDRDFDQALIQTFGNFDFRVIYFTLAVAFLLATAMICVLQIKTPVSLVIAGLMLFVVFFYIVKPFRLIHSGYGEILQASLVAFLIPAFGYSIQTNGELHTTLVYLCVPFFMLVLADQYIEKNRSLSRDIDRYHTTAVMRLGSVVTLRIAVYLIAFSYIFILLLGIAALPWRFILRWYISVPLAVVLIWNVNKVLSGERPAWQVISFLSYSLVLLNLILVLFSFLFIG
jgi:1,4-dihydroxy-2-naphthoate octaprenyltransferase